MASQLVIWCCRVAPLVVLWIALVQEWLPGLHTYTRQGRHLVVFAPVYAVIMLGFYALGNVIYGVATFNDCSEARNELVEEIKEAKADLKRRGVID